MTQEISMKEIPDSQEFCPGEIFRVYENFYDAPKKENYYDYMLVENHGTFLAINVSSHIGGIQKAGNILAEFDTIQDVPRKVVSGKTIKDFIGIESTFWIKRS
ncbi:MAG: hypothetical protein ABJG68_12610 [Crocinitomicaceae bacterium]